MAVFNYKPIHPTLIKPATKWNESDRVWIDVYTQACEAHSYEMRLRIHYMEESKRLLAENEFLNKLLNEVGDE